MLSSLVLGPIQLLFQWVLRVLSPDEKVARE
jgi:hypothetical protein